MHSWFDETVLKLNLDERGRLLGAFRGEDKLLIINNKGESKNGNPSNGTALCSGTWGARTIGCQKKPITAVYYDPEKARYFIKRFLIENENKEDSFIKEGGEDSFTWVPNGAQYSKLNL